MSFQQPTGGCSTLLHLLASYPKTVACTTILVTFVGVKVHKPLTQAEVKQCDGYVAEQCGTTPVAPPPAVPAITVIPSVPTVPGPCASAPVITDADVFHSNGTSFLWKRAGVDPVRGHAPSPYLVKLGYTKAEREVFLQKIEKGDGTMIFLINGVGIGTMTSGSGKMFQNTVVAFNPHINRGTNYKNDARARVYSYTRTVILNGKCVERTVKLLEPFVCQNWSRLSDEVKAVVQ